MPETDSIPWLGAIKTGTNEEQCFPLSDVRRIGRNESGGTTVRFYDGTRIDIEMELEMVKQALSHLMGITVYSNKTTARTLVR